MADESPELFDDIYLGLRAGGQRGNSVAASRSRPTKRRRSAAGGACSLAQVYRDRAFALGTFGLGFTVGGLIFGRWRTARR